MISLILATGCISILALVGMGIYFTIRFTKENDRMEKGIY